ncbi:uncharacterized protein [Atheta coriaria]|uniref:uncharacterized protein n=1 Tax=Dalotia coriaria TaxID=877792 RepID=UPI0031F3C901
MAKLLLIVALCIASALASPSFNIPRRLVANHRIHQQLKSVDGDLATCFQALEATVDEAIIRNAEQLVECTKDCAEELAALEEDLVAAVQGVEEAVQKLVADFQACGSDLNCKAAVIKEIVATLQKYIQDVNAIVEEHLAGLEGKFPEAAECARAVFVQLSGEIKDAGVAFINCVKA